MACHEKNDTGNSCPVEYQSCHAVCIKPGRFRILGTDAVNDMEDHGNKDDSHTKSDRYDKYRIQLSDKR